MYKEYNWMIGQFEKIKEGNPCLLPKEHTTFKCPVRGEIVNWEKKDVFNPAAVVKDGKVYLLYRAEDTVGRFCGTSRIGLAVSDDGISFETMAEPVLYPDNDDFLDVEWEGGCEDPRIVETEDGRYIMTYTGYNGVVAILCVASSRDLINWTKHGPAFKKAYNGKYANLWSKSGAIVCEMKDDRFIAKKINGKYWMYWGESNIYAAVSDDLINWEPVEFQPDGADTKVLLPLVKPRIGSYDEFLCEPGPQAIIRNEGIVLLYNGKGVNHEKLGGHDTIYKAGQLLFDINNPECLISRTTKDFIAPTEKYEFEGQSMPTCFIEGLVRFKGYYYLYYGAADSKVVVARCKAD